MMLAVLLSLSLMPQTVAKSQYDQRGRHNPGHRRGQTARHHQRRGRSRGHDLRSPGNEAVQRAEGRRQDQGHVHRVAGAATPEDRRGRERGYRDAARLAAGTGKSPSVALAKQLTTTVTVVSVDDKTPSLTVKTSDGRTITRKVENRKNIVGVKAGDRIDITYTQAAVAEIVPVK